MKTRNLFMVAGLAALALLTAIGCSDDDPADPGDTTPPAAVTDLRLQSIAGSILTVAWTAPGDDGTEGTATQYDVRYATTAITEATWDACQQVATVPTPVAAGSEQTVAIDASAKADVYVALKAADEVPNWSGLSNVVSGSVDIAFEVHQLTTEGNNINPCVNDGVVTWVRAHGIEGDEIYISNVAVANPAVTRLTDNGGEKAHPSSHGSQKIVWQGRGGGSDDWEIFSYFHLNIPRYFAFTDNDLPDCYPVLAGGGNFAWLQGNPMFEEIHYFNASLHSESVISDDCCPTLEYSNDPPSADDYTVVWRTYHRAGTREHRTYLWRGVLTDLTDEVDATISHNYSLHGGALAYEWGPGQITYWDGVTAQAITQKYEPSLYDGTIAYEVWDGQDWEIRFWDGSEIIEITDNDFNDTQCSLHGDTIAWVGRPPGSADQIFYARILSR
jgi:hypothetical protein